MSEPIGPTRQPARGDDPQAKAEKAHLKAQRPFWKKKRVIIPAVFVAIIAITSISSGGSKKTDTSTTAAGNTPTSSAPSAAASTSASAPSAAAPVAPAAPAVTYVGKLKDDKLAGGSGAPGGEVQLSGWTVTASALAPVKTSFSKNLCTDVVLINRDTKQQDYNGLSWKLQTPGGNVQNITFTGDNDLSSGGLAPNGKVSKSVCFENTNEGAGQHVLSWTPDLFSSKARGIWLNAVA